MALEQPQPGPSVCGQTAEWAVVGGSIATAGRPVDSQQRSMAQEWVSGCSLLCAPRVAHFGQLWHHPFRATPALPLKGAV